MDLAGRRGHVGEQASGRAARACALSMVVASVAVALDGVAAIERYRLGLGLRHHRLPSRLRGLPRRLARRHLDLGAELRLRL